MIVVRAAVADDAAAMSAVLIASISELCAADHHNNPEILDGDHILALPVPEPGVLLDDVERPLGGAAIDREQRAVLEEVDGVVAPLARGDLASVEIEDRIELAPVEADEGLLAWRLRAASPAGVQEIEKFGALVPWFGLGHSQSPCDDGVMMRANAPNRKRLPCSGVLDR